MLFYCNIRYTLDEKPTAFNLNWVDVTDRLFFDWNGPVLVGIMYIDVLLNCRHLQILCPFRGHLQKIRVWIEVEWKLKYVIFSSAFIKYTYALFPQKLHSIHQLYFLLDSMRFDPSNFKACSWTRP